MTGKMFYCVYCVYRSHWVVIPDKYTPGSSIPITFSFFNTSDDVTVQVDLIRDDHHRVSTLRHTFINGNLTFSVKTISFSSN
jgi:hypothetical protein